MSLLSPDFWLPVSAMLFLPYTFCLTNAGSIPPSPPNRYSKRDWYSNQTENEKLKVTACQIGAPVNTAHYVCFSRDINATFASVLSNWTSCAFCTPGDLDASECYYQFENNNDLAVSVHKESCPLKLSVVIQTRTNTTLSLEDSGKIFCSIIDGSSLTNYTTFHLNVFKREEPTQDLLAVEVAVPTGGVLLIIIALLVVIAVLGYKYRTKKTISQRQRTRTRREGQREGDCLVVHSLCRSNCLLGVKCPAYMHCTQCTLIYYLHCVVLGC